MVTKELYPFLFAKKWKDPILLLQDIALREEHSFWGSGGAGREFAREILRLDSSWEWLSNRVDDFACLIENKMRFKLNKWIFRAMLDVGGLSDKLSNTEEATKWLLDRYVAELKNLFDARYKDYIKIDMVYIDVYEDGKVNSIRLPSKSKFKTVKKEEKIETEYKNTQLSLFDFSNFNKEGKI